MRTCTVQKSKCEIFKSSKEWMDLGVFLQKATEFGFKSKYASFIKLLVKIEDSCCVGNLFWRFDISLYAQYVN